jgi:hypothetical protein
MAAMHIWLHGMLNATTMVIIAITMATTGSACCKLVSQCAPFTHSFSRKPFDVWAFVNGIFGNPNAERPDVKSPNMGAFWGAVALNAFAPPLQARSFNSKETLEARDVIDDATKFWVNFAQKELDLPSR